jgi:peptidoglycan-associated lipoprotein
VTRYHTTRGKLVLVALFGAMAVGCQSNGVDPMPSETTTEFREEPMQVKEEVPAVPTLAAIYFDYDASTVRGDAEPTLRENAELIAQHTAWGTVTIEGHCDERGSEEYNVALGARRAAQVKHYLIDLGVPSQRLRTVSLGESRPAVQGWDESAFRHNRRSEFKVSDTLASVR